MDKTVEIIYICTSTYKNYARNFFKSLQYFFPTSKKIIKILTDDIYVVSKILKSIEEDFKDVNLLTIDVMKITDLPYPLINLGKFAYINDYIVEESDYVFYFDADTKFIQKCDEYWNNLQNILDSNKVLLSPHVFYLSSFHEEEYREDQRQYRIYDMEIFKNRCDERKGSVLYDKLHIPDVSYVWASTSFIAGTRDKMLQFTDKANKRLQSVMITEQIDGIAGYSIPRLFDESVANRMIYESYIGSDLDVEFHVKPYAVIREQEIEPNYTFMCQKYGNYENKKHTSWET